MTVTERRIYITVPYPSNYGEGYPKSGEPIHKRRKRIIQERIIQERIIQV